jgi:quinol monooxygenase YgiN
MIIITGNIRCPADTYDELLAALQAGVPATRTEDGCMFYAFAGENAAEGLILVSERWRDDAALQTHLATPAVAALFERFAGRFTPEVRAYDVSGDRALI